MRKCGKRKVRRNNFWNGFGEGANFARLRYYATASRKDHIIQQLCSAVVQTLGWLTLFSEAKREGTLSQCTVLKPTANMPTTNSGERQKKQDREQSYNFETKRTQNLTHTHNHTYYYLCNCESVQHGVKFVCSWRKFFPPVGTKGWYRFPAILTRFKRTLDTTHTNNEMGGKRDYFHTQWHVPTGTFVQHTCSQL